MSDLVKHADAFLSNYKESGKVYFDSLDAALIASLVERVRVLEDSAKEERIWKGRYFVRHVCVKVNKYERMNAALRKIDYEFEEDSMEAMKFYKQISCDICGDMHDIDSIPLSCQTGDGE